MRPQLLQFIITLNSLCDAPDMVDALEFVADKLNKNIDEHVWSIFQKQLPARRPLQSGETLRNAHICTQHTRIECRVQPSNHDGHHDIELSSEIMWAFGEVVFFRVYFPKQLTSPLCTTITLQQLNIATILCGMRGCLASGCGCEWETGRNKVDPRMGCPHFKW